MGVFSDKLSQEVRLEYMRPEELVQAKEQRPAIYVPFGAIEWHGYHNAVGLDGLKAHEQLVGLAVRAGGVVYPPVYFGAGGAHADYPSSFMVGSDPMIALVAELLQRFEADGYEKAILLSGHYPNGGQFLKPAVERYTEAGGTMQILVLVETEAPDVRGDHAAEYETSFMLYLHPDTVNMERLNTEPRDDLGGYLEWLNWLDPKYKDHPCYGILGHDPRSQASIETGRDHVERLLAFLEHWLG